jgi:5'(3')-deoxyribonucleotidase
MKKIFLDMDGTLARFNVPNAINRFEKEINFFANLKAYKDIEIINELAKNNNLYIISASSNERTDKDKMIWLKKYLFNIKEENITFCRIGENKAKVIENKYNISIDKDCYLLDDYTRNLQEWESFGGTGIKRLTSKADNSRKIWKGLEIKRLKQMLSICQ